MAESARDEVGLPRATETPTKNPLYGRLHRRLAGGGFAVTAEVVPPRAASLAGLRRIARVLREWVDAADVGDGQAAEVRLAGWAGCLALLAEGVEPIMQLQCRDRNRIALQADLLAAGAVGVPNLLLLTGDDPRLGDEPDARPVYDLDSVALIAAARTLREDGRLLSGHKLSAAPRWLLGGAENPFRTDRDSLARLAAKADAGAEFIHTQAVFDVPAFAGWMARVRDRGLHERCYLIASVGPLRTRRALDYMQKLPGVSIPEAIVRRLGALPAARLASEATALCAEMIQQLREIEGVAGVHLVGGHADEVVPELLMRAGVGRRPPLDAEAGAEDDAVRDLATSGSGGHP